MSAEKISSIIEELSSAVVMADISDKPALVGLMTLFEDLQKIMSENPDDKTNEIISQSLTLIQNIVLDSSKNPEADLSSVSDNISAVQQAVRQASTPLSSTSKSTPPGRKESKSRKTPSAKSPASEAKGNENKAAEEKSAGGTGEVVLPEWIDAAMFEEFLAAEKSAIDDLEPLILDMENGSAEATAEFKRRVHTIKGECGVVGMYDLQELCHTVEDFIIQCGDKARRTDRLLQFRDWFDKAITAYSQMKNPKPPASKLIDVLKSEYGVKEKAAEPAVKDEELEEPKDDVEKAIMEEAAQAPVPEPKPEPVKGAAPARAVPIKEPVKATPTTNAPKKIAGMEEFTISREEETLSMIGEFLQETAEGLTEADQILMNIEADGLDSEKINALFRVFHTIKGVAGFLEFKDITALAHITETLLNLVRQGTRELIGYALDLVFDSTEMMRSMIGQVRKAAEEDVPVPINERLQPLIDALQDSIDGREPPEDYNPVLSRQKMLGEVLIEDGGVDPDKVKDALDHQVDSGLRIGEQLVADGAAKPKQIAQALRTQKQAAGEKVAVAAKLKETVKIDLERVDSLVEMIGELVIVESMVVNADAIVSIQEPRINNYLSQLGKITRDLQRVGMRMRMVPIRGVFQKMARMVRDLSRRNDKKINFEQSGEDSEMDRSMVENIGDPLVHMIRNSVDHGIETIEERLKTGKPEAGTIKLSAYHEGGSIVIEISDDGKGLDREAILAKAIKVGMIQEGEKLSDQEINALIFAPGFSTAKQVTEISGRGVGMDVVRRNIEGMRGRVLVESVQGQGTVFKMVLPLTLAIIDGMIVRCGEEKYIIPTLSIVESIRPERGMLYSLADKGELINVRGEIFPLYRMDRLFNVVGAQKDPVDALVIILETFGKRLALLVDDVLSQQQVVIKSIDTGLKLMQMKFVSGAAILSDGKVGLILNVEEIGSLSDNTNK